MRGRCTQAPVCVAAANCVGVCVCQSSELRELIFFFIYFALVFVFSAPIYTVKRLLCSVIRVVLSFVYLSLSLPVFSLISSAPIACKMSGNCQLEIMTCLLSEMGGIPHNILIVRIFTE